MGRTWIAAALALGAFAVPARSQNLLTNPDFDNAAQLSGWTEASGKTWSSDDSAGSASSGSVQVPNALSSPSSVLMRQCVPATAGESFDASSEIRVAAGQSAGSVRFNVVFWKVADCIGDDTDATALFSSPEAPTTGDWSLVSASGIAPALSLAGEIQLSVSKSATGGSLIAYFDHVFLPEPRAATAALAALAALGALGRRSWRQSPPNACASSAACCRRCTRSEPPAGAAALGRPA